MCKNDDCVQSALPTDTIWSVLLRFAAGSLRWPEMAGAGFIVFAAAQQTCPTLTLHGVTNRRCLCTGVWQKDPQFPGSGLHLERLSGTPYNHLMRWIPWCPVFDK